MKVTATTLPRRSRSESRARAGVVSLNSGAGPIFERRSLPLASWPAAGADELSPPSARSTAAQIARRPTLPLQLPLELVQKAPVRALADDLLRARLDHACLVKAERVEADAVLGVVLAPAGVRQLA